MRGEDGRPRLVLLWGRLAVTGGIVGVVLWLGVGLAAWGLYHGRQGVKEISLLDAFALPLRWRDVQRKRGDHYIQEGRKALDAGNYSAALQLLRVGVLKAPTNLEGRERLAQMYAVLVRRPDQGIKLLEDGMTYGEANLNYLQTYYALLLANQEDERVRDLAAKRLATAVPGSPSAAIFALSAAQACFFRGDYDGVEHYLSQGRAERSTEGRLLLAQVEWERGDREVSLNHLRELVNGQSPPEKALDLLCGYLRERKETDEARMVASLRELKFPESLGARIGMLYGDADANDRARLDRELDAILQESGRDQRTLLAVADFAVSTGDVALADRIRDAATAEGLAPEIGPLVAIETRIAAGEYAAALTAIEAVSMGKPEWLDAQSDTLAGFQAVANFGLGQKDLGDLYLGKYLDQKNPRADRLATVARRLQKIGANDAARRVLALAVETDAQNQAALTELVALDVHSGRLDDLPHNVDRLLAMRKPPLDLLRQAYERLSAADGSRLPGRDPVLTKLRSAIQQYGGTAAL